MSRVVPGVSETIALSFPTIEFNIVDFPTLGLPIKEILIWFSIFLSFPELLGKVLIIASSKSPTPLPEIAEMKCGSPKPSDRIS